MSKLAQNLYQYGTPLFTAIVIVIASYYSRASENESLRVEVKAVNQRLDGIEAQLDKLEQQKANELRIVVDLHSKQIEAAQNRLSVLEEKYTEMRSDIRIITDWVKDQKSRSSAKN